MKAVRRTAKPVPPPTKRSLSGPQRSPRTPPRPAAPRPTGLSPPFRGEQRRWFDHEVGLLERLAHTARLAGDYVAAQRLERELEAFSAEATALFRESEPYAGDQTSVYGDTRYEID